MLVSYPSPIGEHRLLPVKQSKSRSRSGAYAGGVHKKGSSGKTRKGKAGRRVRGTRRERQRLRKRKLTHWKRLHKKAKGITSVGPLRKGQKTAHNALLALCFNKLQCKPDRSRDIRGSKEGSVAVSELLSTNPENALNACLPLRTTKVQRKPASTRKPQSSDIGSIYQRLQKCTRSALDAYRTAHST
ncbi:hypothetical protein MTO96_032451 [Rhipicephalus appendiculatus]